MTGPPLNPPLSLYLSCVARRGFRQAKQRRGAEELRNRASIALRATVAACMMLGILCLADAAAQHGAAVLPANTLQTRSLLSPRSLQCWITWLVIP